MSETENVNSASNIGGETGGFFGDMVGQFTEGLSGGDASKPASAKNVLDRGLTLGENVVNTTLKAPQDAFSLTHAGVLEVVYELTNMVLYITRSITFLIRMLLNVFIELGEIFISDLIQLVEIVLLFVMVYAIVRDDVVLEVLKILNNSMIAMIQVIGGTITGGLNATTSGFSTVGSVGNAAIQGTADVTKAGIDAGSSVANTVVGSGKEMASSAGRTAKEATSGAARMAYDGYQKGQDRTAAMAEKTRYDELAGNRDAKRYEFDREKQEKQLALEREKLDRADKNKKYDVLKTGLANNPKMNDKYMNMVVQDLALKEAEKTEQADVEESNRQRQEYEENEQDNTPHPHWTPVKPVKPVNTRVENAVKAMEKTRERVRAKGDRIIKQKQRMRNKKSVRDNDTTASDITDDSGGVDIPDTSEASSVSSIPYSSDNNGGKGKIPVKSAERNIKFKNTSEQRLSKARDKVDDDYKIIEPVHIDAGAGENYRVYPRPGAEPIRFPHSTYRFFEKGSWDYNNLKHYYKVNSINRDIDSVPIDGKLYRTDNGAMLERDGVIEKGYRSYSNYLKSGNSGNILAMSDDDTDVEIRARPKSISTGKKPTKSDFKEMREMESEPESLLFDNNEESSSADDEQPLIKSKQRISLDRDDKIKQEGKNVRRISGDIEKTSKSLTDTRKSTAGPQGRSKYGNKIDRPKAKPKEVTKSIRQIINSTKKGSSRERVFVRIDKAVLPSAEHEWESRLIKPSDFGGRETIMLETGPVRRRTQAFKTKQMYVMIFQNMDTGDIVVVRSQNPNAYIILVGQDAEKFKRKMEQLVDSKHLY